MLFAGVDHDKQLVVSEDGTELTGELTGEIVHAERKAFFLQQIAEENGIPLHQVSPVTLLLTPQTLLSVPFLRRLFCVA